MIAKLRVAQLLGLSSRAVGTACRSKLGEGFLVNILLAHERHTIAAAHRSVRLTLLKDHRCIHVLLRHVALYRGDSLLLIKRHSETLCSGFTLLVASLAEFV